VDSRTVDKCLDARSVPSDWKQSNVWSATEGAREAKGGRNWKKHVARFVMRTRREPGVESGPIAGIDHVGPSHDEVGRGYDERPGRNILGRSFVAGLWRHDSDACFRADEKLAARQECEGTP
jgi:hypothetical protein